MSAFDKKKGHGGGGGGHDAGGGMRWLLTYADLITLLLVFFIIAYASASQDAAKMKKVAQSLSNAFSPFTSDKPFPVEGFGEGRGIRSPGQTPASEALTSLTSKIKEATALLENKTAIRYYEDKLTIDIAVPDLFGGDLVTLRDDAKPFLSRLAGLLQIFPNQVEIMAYRRSTSPAANAWPVTSRQASEIARYLAMNGRVDPRRLSSAGLGSNYQRAFQNDHPSSTPNMLADLIGVAPMDSSPIDGVMIMVFEEKEDKR